MKKAALFIIIFLFPFVTLASAADQPEVKVFKNKGQEVALDFLAYESDFEGGVNIAAGDVDGDKEIEIITAPIKDRAPEIRVFSKTGELEASFIPFNEHYRGGVSLTVGDTDGNRIKEIIVTPRTKSEPRVKVYEIKDGQEVLKYEFLAFKNFIGGLSVAAGDIDKNRKDEVVVAPLYGGVAHIKAFRKNGVETTLNIYPFSDDYYGGVSLAVGDLNNDKRAEIVVAPARVAQAKVKVYETRNKTVIKEFLAYPETFEGGASLAVGDIDGDKKSEIITAAGKKGGPHLRAWRLNKKAQYFGFMAYDTAWRGGVSLATADFDQDKKAEILTAPCPKPDFRKRVALTFDDGYSSSNGSFNKILSTLERRGVRATFFFIGQWDASHPSELKRIDANPNFLIGNHSYTHAVFTRIPEEQMRRELDDTEAVLQSILGHGAKPNFRYPGGGHNYDTDLVVEGMGFRYFQWNASTADTQYKAATAENIRSVIEGATMRNRDKTIVLSHMSSDATAAGLDEIIDIFERRDFQFVTVDELFDE